MSNYLNNHEAMQMEHTLHYWLENQPEAKLCNLTL